MKRKVLSKQRLSQLHQAKIARRWLNRNFWKICKINVGIAYASGSFKKMHAKSVQAAVRGMR